MESAIGVTHEACTHMQRAQAYRSLRGRRHADDGGSLCAWKAAILKDRMQKPTLRRRSILIGGLVACLGGGQACSRSSAEAPPPAATLAPAPIAPPIVDAMPPAATLASATLVHTLSEGESLWDVSRAYGLSIQQIMDQNGLKASDAKRIRTGRQLKLQGAARSTPVETPLDRKHNPPKPLPPLTDGAYHYLEQGESLWTLARRYDVSIDAIMARNGFSEDVHGQLQIGQPIIIPGLSASQIEAPRPRVNEPGKRAPSGPGVNHEIARGETVWDLARTYGVSVAEIMAANRLNADAVQNIREGQTLFLPGIEDDGRGHVKRKPTAREGRAHVVASQLGLGGLQAAGRLLHGQVERRWIAAAGGGGIFAGTLRWPVSQGWFVRGFGSGQGGYHKAMDIMGKTGWNVHAAADGIVGYAGDKVSGFGNMVMLVHAGGWVTLYAHNSVNFVSAGQRVQKGAVLAEVGSTGRSTGPHVHFELIYDGKNCDPAPLFRPGVRHRSGKISSLAYTSWRDPGKRPKSVQCAVRQKHPMPVLSEDPVQDATRVDDRDTRDAPAFDDLVEELLH
jgi:murein DD-endopeptidase MepM/ murein hydrolase activator NlpD